jgi:hypothetical protein
MSAAEVIEQIRALPREEQAQVREFVTKELAVEGGRSGVMDDATFDKAQEYVFNNYKELLRRLAQ